MKAILVHEFGAPEVMKLEETSAPTPAAGQVLVSVKAAGVNPSDTYMRAGAYAVKPPLPYTPGSDGAGVVEAVGDGIKKVKKGDRVYLARTVSGSYAEFALALEPQVNRLPDRVSFSQGAGVYVPYGTSYRALHQIARARADETLLVHGASGGVGIAAVQMARAMGMTIIGTAGSEKGLELVKREGADFAINHHTPNYTEEIMKATGGRGVNVILEMLANVNLGSDLKMLAPHGRVVVIGSRGEVNLLPRDLMLKDSSVHGMLLWNVSPADFADINAGVVAGLDNGSLRPVVGKEMGLEDAPRAHKEVLEPGAYGKIVLLP